jgi:hypothetical protein
MVHQGHVDLVSASGSWVLDGSRGFCFLGFFVSDGLRVLVVSAGLFGSSVCLRIERVRTWFLLLIHYTSLASSFPPGIVAQPDTNRPLTYLQLLR